jgi:hypothetical protein
VAGSVRQATGRGSCGSGNACPSKDGSWTYPCLLTQFHLHGSPAPRCANIFVVAKSQFKRHFPSISFDLYEFIMLAGTWIWMYSFKGCCVTHFLRPPPVTLSVRLFDAVSSVLFELSNGATMMRKGTGLNLVACFVLVQGM